MQLNLYRNYFRKNYIIGKLFIGDDYYCDTLEPCYQSSHGAVPVGSYPITFNVVSPKFRNRFPYDSLCKGCVPRLLNVPGRSGILIHVGNEPNDTSGCILVGKNTVVGKVTSSICTFTNLYKRISKSNCSINIYNVPLDKQSINYVPLTEAN